MTTRQDDNQIINAMSFDIEDWFHIVGIRATEDPEQWSEFPSIALERTRGILQTLQQHQVRGTFFMLGWTAQQHPELAREIADAGHELALHSWWHRRVDQLTPEQFREDISKNKDLIEQQSGQRVIGFRAPTFSLVPGTEWAFDIMHELGLEYDASLFPARRGHGGYPCSDGPHEFTGTPSGRPMPELPMTVLPIGPFRVAFSGGGYLRLFPKWFIRWGFARTNGRNLPVVVYLHPRDFAPDQPRPSMPPHRRFKSYVGLSTTQGKFEMMLENYRFDTCASILGLESG